MSVGEKCECCAFVGAHAVHCPVLVKESALRQERIAAALERIAQALEDELWRIANGVADGGK